MKIRVMKLFLATLCAILLYFSFISPIVELNSAQFTYLETIKKVFGDVQKNYDSYETVKERIGYVGGMLIFGLSLTFVLLGQLIYILKGTLGFFSRKKLKLISPLFFCFVGLGIFFSGHNYFNGNYDASKHSDMVNTLAVAFQTYQATQTFYFLAIAVVATNIYALIINYVVRSSARQEREDAKAYRLRKKAQKK